MKNAPSDIRASEKQVVAEDLGWDSELQSVIGCPQHGDAAVLKILDFTIHHFLSRNWMPSIHGVCECISQSVQFLDVPPVVMGPSSRSISRTKTHVDGKLWTPLVVIFISVQELVKPFKGASSLYLVRSK